ncbi:BglG family transcription antiterminator [Paenactinomyces guangxiensis]|uniref:BglG family transcription antiterminator n=1 Tax=Paenactinomyces guangxiensis TaxID=1490290 RepID=A0A7W1WSN2_9BACL|nr:PRD domain-containing protein [Paenactinomyces guangxiensis]MBA4495239.1 BglG family transcription antiterminator [Paenactinomyces guangxiensis]MBH8592323.1 BglG family transcription antiterminator [Paenactinomyces guangxiensis]
MYISARERKILEVLLLKEDLTTINDLAKELAVSPRTVHRDLKGIEEILKEYKLRLYKKSGIGIGIIGDEKYKSRLQTFLFNLSHVEYTPEERKTIILSALLDASEPVKLVSLANDLNVTIATISNDLNKVEDRISPFGLSLIRKRGYGVEIKGSETSKRKVMSNLILDHLDEFEFLALIKERIQKKSSGDIKTITDKLLGLVDKKKLLIIEQKVERIKEELPYSVADSAYMGLVVHLALAVERIQQGEEIDFDQQYLESMKGTREYQAAAKIVSELEEAFNISISNGEIGYIAMHLMGAKLRSDHEVLLEDTSFRIGIKAQELICAVSKRIKKNLTKNAELFQGLVAHLRPAVYRMRQNMYIHNPLLPRIEAEYNELFTIVEKEAKRIFPDLHVPKEETGYLVMHFVSALLKREEMTEKQALVVCSSGIGTSKMLSAKLQRELPGLKPVNVSLFELDHMNPDEYDVMISTVPLKGYEGDYILASPFLSDEDIEKVKKMIQIGMNRGRIEQTQTSTRDGQMESNHFMQEIESVKKISTSIFLLLNNFVVKERSASSIEKLLQKACEELEDKGLIKEADNVKNRLLEREKTGGLGIPGTSLALYHTKSDDVLSPSFTVYRLHDHLKTCGMDGSAMEITTILLMLCPEKADDETLEILSYISTLIIRDQESIRLFEQDDHRSVMNYLTRQLKEFFLNKVKEKKQ